MTLQVTLQYCLWDQWKTVTATEPRRLLCLAGLVGQLLSSCVLPLSSLKPVSNSISSGGASVACVLLSSECGHGVCRFCVVLSLIPR